MSEEEIPEEFLQVSTDRAEILLSAGGWCTNEMLSGHAAGKTILLLVEHVRYLQGRLKGAIRIEYDDGDYWTSEYE